MMEANAGASAEISITKFPRCRCGASVDKHPTHACPTYQPDGKIVDLGVVSVQDLTAEQLAKFKEL
jgi:hypothetical protein